MPPPPSREVVPSPYPYWMQKMSTGTKDEFFYDAHTTYLKHAHDCDFAVLNENLLRMEALRKELDELEKSAEARRSWKALDLTRQLRHMGAIQEGIQRRYDARPDVYQMFKTARKNGVFFDVFASSPHTRQKWGSVMPAYTFPLEFYV